MGRFRALSKAGDLNKSHTEGDMIFFVFKMNMNH